MPLATPSLQLNRRDIFYASGIYLGDEADEPVARFLRLKMGLGQWPQLFGIAGIEPFCHLLNHQRGLLFIPATDIKRAFPTPARH
jgi:hypothetical protein